MAMTGQFGFFNMRLTFPSQWSEEAGGISGGTPCHGLATQPRCRGTKQAIGRLPPRSGRGQCRRTVVANTDKTGAGQTAGDSNDTACKSGTEQRPDAAKPSGDSPKPHGDPLLHVVKDKD